MRLTGAVTPTSILQSRAGLRMVASNGGADAGSPVPRGGKVIVAKFGGTSVADAPGLARLCGIARARLDEGLLVVVSALAGVSDVLDRVFKSSTILQGAATDSSATLENEAQTRVGETLATLEQRHTELLSAVNGRATNLAPWLGLLRAGPAGDTPSAYAEWMALGELLSSEIVTAALASSGIAARWFDVRQVLRTRGEDPARDRPDDEVTRRLCDRHLERDIAGGHVVVTQGFIGCDRDGRTTLLGRGGSDLTASILGAALGAQRIEIWTDVDGVLTAPPKIVPTARRLKVLSFEEAAELAYFGAKVLHPASIRPAQEANVPVLVANSRRATSGTEADGTLILPDTKDLQDERSVVRSIAIKKGICVVTVHSSRMLMAHGFLERIFSVFSKYATPVDLVSTSEVSVSLTVDETLALPQILDELLAIAQVESTRDTAIVCVVGEGMRRARGIPARIFRAVGNVEVRMISQGASEINVSLVVSASDADGVVRRLHDEFFQGNLPQRIFGESFADLEAQTTSAQTPQTMAHPLAELAEQLAQEHGTPFYMYELDRIEAQIDKLRHALAPVRARLFYACKANFHPEVFRLMASAGVGVDAVSPMETERAMECGIAAENILFTANNMPFPSLLAVHDRGVQVNLGSSSDIRRFAEARPGSEVFLRINPGVGDGHHDHVVTGGADSKFGILPGDLHESVAVLAAHNVRVVGLHAHIGSGIQEPARLLESARRLLDVATDLPHVRVLNLGGGFGVPYRNDDPEFDLEALAGELVAFADESEHRLGRRVEIWVEPGRYLVAQAGTLVARVTCRKESGGHVYIGLDTGMNHLLRPALYGAYHRVRNLSDPAAPREFVDVVGNICETADVLAFNRPVPSPQEGHLLAIEDVGAYGFAMASHYNLWPLPREFVVRNRQLY